MEGNDFIAFLQRLRKLRDEAEDLYAVACENGRENTAALLSQVLRDLSPVIPEWKASYLVTKSATTVPQSGE